MFILLTVIYIFKVDTSYIVSLLTNYVFLPLNDPSPIELQKNEIIFFIAFTQIPHLITYFSLICDCIQEGDISKKNLAFSIFISYFLFSYIHMWLFYFILHKFYNYVNIDKEKVFYIILTIFYTLYLLFISFEKWILFRFNLYLYFKKIKKQIK